MRNSDIERMTSERIAHMSWNEATMVVPGPSWESLEPAQRERLIAFATASSRVARRVAAADLATAKRMFRERLSEVLAKLDLFLEYDWR